MLVFDYFRRTNRSTCGSAILRLQRIDGASETESLVIEDFPASEQPVWRLVAQESLALLAAGVLYPFGLRAPRRSTPRRPAQRTVVLVHGYLANRSTLLPLAGYLRWRGFHQVLSFNYRSS